MKESSLEISPEAKGIRFTLTVPVEFTHEGDWVHSRCDALEVYSQGHDRVEAEKNIIEALQLFIESCYRRGTLEQILKEYNFVPARKPIATDLAQDVSQYMVDVPLDLLVANHVQQTQAN